MTKKEKTEKCYGVRGCQSKWNIISASRFSTQILDHPILTESAALIVIFVSKTLWKKYDQKRQAFKVAEETANIHSDDTLSSETVYAYDADFIQPNNQIPNPNNQNGYKQNHRPFKKNNLHANPKKTEIIIPTRDAIKINEKHWRVRKFGSLLDDEKDIINRKILALAAFSKLQKI